MVFNKIIQDEVLFDMRAAAISEHEDKVFKDKDGEVFYRYQQFTDQMAEESRTSGKRWMTRYIWYCCSYIIILFTNMNNKKYWQLIFTF